MTKYTIIDSNKRNGSSHIPFFIDTPNLGQWGYDAYIEACKKQNISYPKKDESGVLIFDDVTDAYMFIKSCDLYFPHFPTNFMNIVIYKNYDFTKVKLPNWFSIKRDERHCCMELVDIT